ncbi:VOC family protein [Pseudonocardia oroxyli]|uniref:VOC domain-containing protein n=1 Tax=Pseudonocardia oroxyli TaxID=366584 RepID=A0A1G8DXB7_PSEOR|nr:VOC family protein [Pseudonocardia oroxyli]SDH62376.1 hypothetical protein SAMN05216377_12914 [Pseudonocardia oroxyli]
MTFKITKLFHLIHMTDDFAALDKWYEEVFGAVRFTDGVRGFPYLDVEKRDATLTAVAGVCIEPLAPAFEVEGADEAPIGRFYRKFGSHWHSIAWHLDDPLDLSRHLKDKGVRIFGRGGTTEAPTAADPIFTHPKDTVCALEFMTREAVSQLPDPRYVDPDYDSIDWTTRTPLGLKDLGYVTVTTTDLDRAKKVFVEWLDGHVLGESTSDLTGTRDVYVQVGEIVVQLAQPVGTDSLAAVDLARNGESLHSVTWQVADLAKAKTFLADKGVTAAAEDAHTLLADPAGTFGAYHRFTDLSVGQLTRI